jgi:cation:H+ antiporter
MVFILIGIGLLYAGAEALVRGSSRLAAHFGIPPLVIGLTIVAAGTSLPELATSLVAAIKGESEVAIGNIVGSNIFNLLGILGLTAAIVPTDVGGVGLLDAAFMLGLAVLLLPIAYTQRAISRIEGSLFLGIYGAYIYLLWPTS